MALDPAAINAYGVAMSNHAPPVALNRAGHSEAAIADAPARFSIRLRDETALVHREAERTGFIADLIRGRATLAGYGRFLRCLVPVYAALERGLDKHVGNAVLVVFAQPSLRRLPRLLDDINAIERWNPADESVSPEAVAYAAAIDEAASGDGLRLVGHAYARYLGDLSGGQILKPILSRSLRLTPPQLHFYDFPDLEPDFVKAAMRDALDSVPASGDAADMIVAEALSAFRHNIALSLAVSRASAATS